MRKLFSPFILIIVVLSATPTWCYCQSDSTNTIGHVSIASPTAASLGKYGDIPVSYHTGIPNIDIPLYTVAAGSLKLPIGLSYHASGLKVQEPSSWVGAGWTLNAGGAITRTVVGAPDDRGCLGSNVMYGHYTDYGYNSIMQTNDIGVILDQISKGYIDGQPDLYFFNFGGYSGKFYFNDDRTPMFVPEQDFKVQPFLQSGTGFIGFIVTTSDGTRYYFGGTGNNSAVTPIEITNPFTVQNGPSNTTAAISTWFLNKIISADGVDSITFDYQQEDYSYYAVSSFPVSNTVYKKIDAGYNYQIGIDLTKNLVQGVRLSQINSPNGTVTFTKAGVPRTDLSDSYGVGVTNTMTDNANTNSYALGSISISDNQGFCKKDSFYTGYFYDNSALYGSFYNLFSIYNIHSDKYRLRLDSIQETTCDGQLKTPPYVFSYFGEPVPRRLSFGIDHWGYSNGVTNNETLVPTFTEIVNGSATVTQGADREAQWPQMRAGSLSQIKYPTGGNSSFDYEPKNSYAFTNSVYQNTQVGAQLVAHDYFQTSTLSQTLSYTFTGSGAITISVTAHGGYSPMLTINNSSNVQVYNSGFIPANATTDLTPSLSAGTYSITLAFPPNMPLNDTSGAHATIYQWQYVPVTTTKLVGGLRIKIITNNDGITANDIVTSYNYNGGGATSTGVLYSIPTYVQIVRNDVNKLVWGGLAGVCSPNGCSSCDGTAQMPVTAHEYYISPASIRPMATLQGENVGYNEVQVSQTGNGHSVYRYYGSNLWNVNVSDVCVRSITQSSLCDANIPNSPAPPLPFEFMRDELQYEAHFNEAGQLLKEVYYNPQYTADPLKTPGHVSMRLPHFASFTEYWLETAKKTRDSVTTVSYDPSSARRVVSSKKTYYGSPYHNQPTRVVTNTSTGDSLAINTKYAMDFRITSCDAIPDSLPYYLSAIHNDSVWLLPTLDTCSPQSPGATASSCRILTHAQFLIRLAQDRMKFIAYRRRSYADPGNLQSACYLTAKNSADAILKPILRLQDNFNNAPIEVSEWKNQNLRHASFTRYDTSGSPVGFAYPGRTMLINLQSPVSTFTAAAVSGSTVTWDNKYQNEAFYKFTNGRTMQVLGRNGVPASYVWDYNNTQPVAKVANSSVDQIAYTSFESDGTGSWTIPSSNRDTGALTGSKSYNLSYGACSRSGLTASNRYTVSYWSKTGASFTVTGSTGVIQGKFIKGWTYFQHNVTGVTSVTVSAASGGIDELRLYPALAQMTTYTYSLLVGMTSQTDANNRTTYYGYDGLGRLKTIKDMDDNFLKVYDYKYAHYISNSAVWTTTGQLRCKPCSGNISYTINMQQHEEKDINPASSTYNNSRWIDDGTPGSCVISPGWQNTATATRCIQSNGTNTGYQEQEQKDLNPCSPTYNQIRWLNIGQNLTACPYNCNGTNCAGNNHKCVNSVCETGTLGVISRHQSGTGINATCTTNWGYFFSDGTYIFDHLSTMNGNCPINP